MQTINSAIPLKRARPWSPRAAIAPKTHRHGEELIVKSNGSRGCYGGWEVVYRAPKPGRWIRFRVRARWRELERGYDSVNVAVTWLGDKSQMVGWEPVFPLKVEKGHVIYEGRVRVPEGAKVMAAKLLIFCSGRGEIRWSDIQLRRTTAPGPRRLRLGAAGGSPATGKATGNQ